MVLTRIAWAAIVTSASLVFSGPSVWTCIVGSRFSYHIVAVFELTAAILEEIGRIIQFI